MKKIYLSLLGLGLIMVFSSPAMAVDVKFNGEYSAAGMYMDNTSFKENDGSSTAFYYQRLRLGTQFIVSPGLKFITRADIMERAWGAARTAAGTATDVQSSGTVAENENIAFDFAYVQYESPIGMFRIGYSQGSAWALPIGNTAVPQGKIAYLNFTTIPNFSWGAELGKLGENSLTANKKAAGLPGYTDADMDFFCLWVNYKWTQAEAGVFYMYIHDATNRPADKGAYRGDTPIKLMPYFKAQLGPVHLQSEIIYQNKNFREYDDAGGDIDAEAWGGIIEADVTLDPVYFGASFAYLSGDDPDTAKIEGGVNGGVNGGNDWNPCLILWNYDRAYWAGSLNGYGAAADANSYTMNNAFFYQARAGVKPTDKLDIMTSVSYAYADEKPVGYESDKYGWEVDLVGTYKITNNLSYMLGLGYLFTGDYYKGATNNDVQDNYMVMNKLTFTF